MHRFKQKITDFLVASYWSDKIAFWIELFSLIITVTAALILASNAKSPQMEIVYPLFLVGSVTGAYAYWRRELIWPFLLTTFYIGINIFGIFVVFY